MPVSIRDHGARPGGQFLNTHAIQAAIDAAAADGGGTVVIPAGVWLTGMIRLRDRIHLHLEGGAVLLASPRWEDYEQRTDLTQDPHSDRSGSGQGLFHLLLAQGCRDIAITGQGRFDGNGTAYYKPGAELSWPLATDNAKRMRSCIEISHCQDVRLDGITIGNTCNWTLHLHESDRVRVSGIRIDNPANAPNADGIDIGGCRQVAISDCFIDTCDDAICLKTYPGGRSCEDVSVTNCIIRTHCVALKFGCIESHADMRKVTFANCVVRGSHRAVGIYSLHGGTVEDIAVSNIVSDTRAPLMFTRPIHIDLRQRTPGIPLGRVRHVRIEGLRAETTGRILMTAQPGAQLEDIALRDIDLRYVAVDDPAIKGATVGGSQFSNANPWARCERAAVVGENIKDLEIDGLRIRWPSGPAPEAWRFPRKMANGTHELFTPPDWESDAAIAGVSLRGVAGGGMRASRVGGWKGGAGVRTIHSVWNAAG